MPRVQILQREIWHAPANRQLGGRVRPATPKGDGPNQLWGRELGLAIHLVLDKARDVGAERANCGRVQSVCVRGELDQLAHELFSLAASPSPQTNSWPN
jgi:hypothetical protein